jgi:hypothetical protein
LFSDRFGSSDQKFHAFQFFLCALLPQTDPNAGDRDAHFQQAVIDAGMGGILWVAYFIQRQVGGDDQRLLAAVLSKPEVIVPV